MAAKSENKHNFSFPKDDEFQKSVRDTSRTDFPIDIKAKSAIY